MQDSFNQKFSTGRLRIVSANITSMLSQLDVVTHLPGDILALQETRMGEGAQKHMTKVLAESGWAIAWGKPMPLISLAAGSSPTLWSTHAGGCAVAVRCGTPIRPIPPVSEAVRALWEAGRWCHATIPWGGGSSLGEVPILLAGDFNLESFQLPSLSTACTNGGWHDLANLFATATASPPVRPDRGPAGPRRPAWCPL